MLTNVKKSLNSLNSNQLSQQIDKTEKEEKKNSDKLVGAITSLNKTLIKIEKDSLKQTGKDRQTIGGLLNSAKLSAGKFTTKAGIAGMIADSVAHKPVLGAIMGQVAAHYENKAENKAREKSFVATVATGTKFGREMVAEKGKAGAAKEIQTLYKEKTRLENLVESKKAKQSAIKELGKEHGVEADLNEKDLTELAENEARLAKMLKTIAEGLEKAPKEEPKEKEKPEEKEDLDARRQELLDAVKEGMQAAYAEMSDEERELLSKQDPEKLKGIMEGIEADILKLNKSQLDELEKIQKTLDDQSAIDKEAELEAKAKVFSAPAKEEKKEEKKEQLLGSLLKGIQNVFSPVKSLISGFGKVAGMIGRFIPMIGSMLSGLAPILGPAAAVAAAGAAGAWVGGKINDLVEEKTGDTVGGNAYNLMDSAKGSFVGNMLGFESDAQRTARVDKEEAQKLYDKKISAGEKITPKSAEFFRSKGVEVDPKMIGEAPATPVDQNAAKNVRAIDNELAKDTNTAATAKLEKESYMEKATDAIVEMSDQVDEATSRKHEAVSSSPTIVNAPKTVNNTTQNIVRPQIRNPDPTYIKVESRRFAF